MNALPLVVAVPLLAAALLAAPAATARLRCAVTVGVSAAVLAGAVVLTAATAHGAVPAARVGGWPHRVAVVFAADAFGALLLATTALVVLTCSVFAAAAGRFGDPPFAPLVLVLSAGVYGALLTADLFDLFVFVEVMLVPSYALLAAEAAARRTGAARIYVGVNVLASTALLVGVGLLYGVTGTVNLGELAGRGREPGVGVAGAVVLVALATKAALVPVHAWLPRTYPHATPVVTALLSGLLTKVGVYAVFRVYALLFGRDPGSRWLVLTVAGVSMVVGALGAVGGQGMLQILSFHLVSQIGYVTLGLGMFGPAGLTAAVFYLVQYILAKTSLFLAAGVADAARGTTALGRLGGLAREQPLAAAGFLGAALSLAGVPPSAGFVGKYVLLEVAVVREQYVVAGLVVGVSLLTLVSMTKMWKALSAPPADPRPSAVPPATPAVSPATPAVPPTTPAGLAVSPVVLAVVVVALGIGAQGLLELSGQAAAGLVHTGPYVRAVSGR